MRTWEITVVLMEFLTTPSGQIYSKSPAFTHCQMSASIEPIWISSLNWIAEIDSRIASVMQPVFRLIDLPAIKMLLILFHCSGLTKTFRCSNQTFFEHHRKTPPWNRHNPSTGRATCQNPKLPVRYDTTPCLRSRKGRSSTQQSEFASLASGPPASVVRL